MRAGRLASLFCLALSATCCIRAQVPETPSNNPDPMLRGFHDPPNSARPRVWWHWMNGNISQEGIKLDLDWMHRVGLGGVTIFEGAIDTPQVVPQRLIYMTPEWKQAFTYAVTTAKSLDMDVAIASSPGWSETGGPWVPPAQGMKKMVWSATRVEGGQPFTGKLPHPPDVDGTFQNASLPQRRGADGVIIPRPQFYADAAVIAYRIPDGDKTQAELNPRITASGGDINAAALSDGDVNTLALDLPAEIPGTEAWVQFDYGKPQAIQAVTLATLDDAISPWDDADSFDAPQLEASDNGEIFYPIAGIPASSIVQRTISFSAVTARYFRLVYSTPAYNTPAHDHKITELVLACGARVNEFEKRAGFATALDYYAIPDPSVSPQSVVPESDVIDLTSKMSPDGTLDWTPPDGNWMILRIGYSLTGHENGPAPAKATGLEVDKLNAAYVKNYLDNYLKLYSGTVGPSLMGDAGISSLLTDSIEAGPQNWTDNILDEFKQRCGYDPLPWLPALTGVVIKSTADTDRFLWDFRRTIAQLLADNHYGTIADELHKRGMTYLSEALEYHRPQLGDDMEMRSKADIPMGAMWTFSGNAGPDPDYIADLRGAASVAHIYGQNIVGAESMTSRGPAWSFSPDTLKKIADLEFASGVNFIEIHESTHQPVVDMAPGLTLGQYGLWFNRNETWAEEAGPWVSYLARCSYLLQQGHYHADVAYFYGEEAPLTALFASKTPNDLPAGYAWDYVNSDVILHQLSVNDGSLVTPGGTSYRILYLGGSSRRMTLPVLRKLQDLVSQGAVIVGNRPIDSPSLADDQNEFNTIADELWGKKTGLLGIIHRAVKGKVYFGITPEMALADLGVQKDFEAENTQPGVPLLFVHRKLIDGDIYFIDNQSGQAIDTDAKFRVDSKRPELWDPATGKSHPVSYSIAAGRTTILLHLDSWGTAFVVFRTPATENSLRLPESHEAQLAGLNDALSQDWAVTFEPGRGAPESAKFDRLTSWGDNSDPGIKYFSGTATYSRTIQIPASALTPGARVWLDLGNVRDVAEVAVNGKYFGILWKSPYKVDITDALKAGDNQFVIEVTNLWVNRLIGDQQPYALKKYAFSDFAPYKADSPLLPSGLLGPVQLTSVAEDTNP